MFLSRIKIVYQGSQIFVLIFFILLATGCKEKLTYSYLLTHPAILKDAITDCKDSDTPSPEMTTHCEMVLTAAENIASIITEQQADYEKFGQRILQTEIAYGKAKESIQTARQQLALLKRDRAAQDVIQAAQVALDKAKQACEAKQQEVQVLLAVVGMNSPE